VLRCAEARNFRYHQQHNNGTYIKEEKVNGLSMMMRNAVPDSSLVFSDLLLSLIAAKEEVVSSRPFKDLVRTK
jgi:hypothetical protein